MSPAFVLDCARLALLPFEHSRQIQAVRRAEIAEKKRYRKPFMSKHRQVTKERPLHDVEWSAAKR